MSFEFEGTRRIVFSADGEDAWFVPVCKRCGRFVKADAVVTFTYDGPPKPGPNATCSKCGRVEMYFEGYY